ncbi:hypothetical protein FQR65_LT10006 [Abscondita terminalis]|nr:hypothetical protein FQR65_LT10006 [Abscondita terminalis]
MFTKEETITYVFENREDVWVPKLNNPSVIIVLGEHIKYLESTLSELRNSSIWSNKHSSRGKFILVTPKSDALELIFAAFWSADIINVVLIINNSLVPLLVTSNPFNKDSNCQKNVQIRQENCSIGCLKNLINRKLSLTNCRIKLISAVNMPANTLVSLSISNAIAKYTVELIGSMLNATISFPLSQGDITDKEMINNYNTDIVVFPLPIRSWDYYKKYDFSILLYRDEVVWVVPKTHQISGVKIIYKAFKWNTWIIVLLISITTTLLWWKIATTVNDKEVFQKLSNCCIRVFLLSLNASTNIVPKRNSLRILMLLYLFYSFEVCNIFQGKLFSLISNPGYEQSISNVYQLSEDKRPILVHPLVNKTMLLDGNNDVFTKLRSRFLVQTYYNTTYNIHQTAYFQNSTTHIPKRILYKMFTKEKTMLDIITKHTGLMESETIIIMRQGHFFLQTFNKLSRLFIEYGFYEKLLASGYKANYIEEERDIDSLTNLEGIFIMIGFGLTVSILFFLTELLVFYHKDVKKCLFSNMIIKSRTANFKKRINNNIQSIYCSKSSTICYH